MLHARPRFFAIVSAVAALGLAACEGSKSPTEIIDSTGGNPGTCPTGQQGTPPNCTPIPVGTTPIASSVAADSGAGQTGTVGAALGTPLVVRVKDQLGNAFAGAAVTWTVTSGTGSLAPTTGTTDANGRARTTLTLSNTAGPVVVTATVAGISGAAGITAFSATATAGAPAAVTMVSGGSQADTVRALLKDSLSVRVVDAFGNPLSGTNVAFSVVSGGGTVSAATAQTNAQGVARVNWTLGTTVGTQSVKATVAGLPDITFTATARPGNIASVTTVSGDAQSALVGLAVPNRIILKVTDAYGNVISGAPVVWTASGGGTITPTSPTSDATGQASATWKLGPTPGPQTATANVNNVTLTFGATGTLLYATLDAGGFHTCGITPSNQAFCWGYNGDGQLGSGNLADRNTPVGVNGSLTFRQLSGGRYHTCAITLAGIGYCWGQNNDGRLGTADQTPHETPTQLSTPVSFRQISAGRVHSCGLSLSNELYCWGWNGEGEVGPVVTPDADSLVFPAPYRRTKQQFDSLSVGGLHQCMIDPAGKGWCMGDNKYGQLGDNTTISSQNGNDSLTIIPLGPGKADSICAPRCGQAQPVTMPAGVTFKQISAGFQHNCAVGSDAAVYCWGENQYGQLGLGTTSTRVLVPTKIVTPAGASFAMVSAGIRHTCATTTAGAIYCWGEGADGKLGTGTTTSSTSPVAVTPVAGLTFSKVSAGEAMSCALSNQNTIYCWGNNNFGQLGDGTNTPRLAPTKAIFQP